MVNRMRPSKETERAIFAPSRRSAASRFAAGAKMATNGGLAKFAPKPVAAASEILKKIRIRRIHTARPLRLMIAAVAAAMLFAGGAYNLVSGGRVNQKQPEKIEAGIQDLRQLRFKQPLPLVVKSADQAGAMMEADLMRDYTDNRLRVDGVAGALTGLYPAGIDLKAESLKLLK